jgi:dienelactone hydrolase
MRVSPVSQLTKIKPAPLAGRYSGYLKFQGKQLPTMVDFEEIGGEQTAFITTPDNLQLRMPARQVCYNPPFIGFSISENNQALRLGGKIEGDAINGKVASREFPAVLVLTQDAHYKPLKTSYKIEKVKIINGETKLEANLYLPNGKKRAPAVVMIAGTGQRTKEEYNGWADLLASNGFAVLTYDKRNVTNFPSLNIRNAPTDIGTMSDLAEDAAQAFRLLRDRKEIDPKKIGFIGFSQGAVVAPIAATNIRKAAFVVAISGNTTSDREFIINQMLNRLRARRADEFVLKKAEDLWNKLFDYAKTRTGGDILLKELEAAHNESWSRFAVPRNLPNEDELKHLMTWNSFELDPAAYWAKVDVPALLVYGERDDLIPVNRSVEIINRLFVGKPDLLSVKVYPNANHLIRTIPASQSFEWSKFAGGYLENLIAWIKQKTDSN